MRQMGDEAGRMCKFAPLPFLLGTLSKYLFILRRLCRPARAVCKLEIHKVCLRLQTFAPNAIPRRISEKLFFERA